MYLLSTVGHQLRYLPVPEAGEGVERDYLALLVAEQLHELRQGLGVLAAEVRPLGEGLLPVLGRHGHRALRGPEPAHGQVARYTHEPGRGLTLGDIAPRAQLRAHKGLLHDVLGLVRVLEKAQRVSEDRLARELVEPAQGLRVALSHARYAPVELLGPAPGQGGRLE